MMGFPTAFTLMGLGMLFGFYAFYNPVEPWIDNRVFDLMVQRTYGAMTNDVLISIPLFVLMGYVMERGALVDKMFYSIQLSFRRVPASLAVTTLIVCTFWGIASGLVGAVVVLMGVIAMNPMLRAGYDVKLASGVITAGGTLGILIPPSVMIIVYAAVAGQSVVKLYAATMFPGFFLALLCPRLGDAQSEDRAAAAGGTDARTGAAMDEAFRRGLFIQHARRSSRRSRFAVTRARDQGGGGTAHLLETRQEPCCGVRSASADGVHARSSLVVCRHSSTGRRDRSTGGAGRARRAACGFRTCDG
jgi:hypothetical protein